MSDYHIHPHYKEPEPLDMRGTISENWVVDKYGLPDASYVTDCYFRYGVVPTGQVLKMKRTWCVVCKFPQDVELETDL